MPAHITFRDAVELRAGYVLRDHAGTLARMGLERLAGHAASGSLLVKTKKGRALMGWSDDDHDEADPRVRLADLKHAQEQQRRRREIVCTTHAECRKHLNAFNGGKEMFPKSAPTAYQSMITLKGAKGYNAKDHANFKIEWDLFLKPGTEFDAALQQLFTQGWTITLIRGRLEHGQQLKRMEGKKPGKPMQILWTSA